jgi:predicted MPP superfamily phosphohydrolase
LDIERETKTLDASADDVLLHSFLHHLLVFFHRPATWPVGLVGVVVLAILAGVGGFWWLLPPVREMALPATAALALFVAADGFLFIQLPRRRLSFGPWKSHLFLFALLRAIGAGVAAVLGVWLGAFWGLAVLVLAQVAGTAALVWGTVFEPFRLSLTELAIEVEGWPAGSPSLRVLHISDLHVERPTVREKRVVELARQAKADLILVTGDYLNLSYSEDPEAMAGARQVLTQLSAPLGVYATLGSPPVDLRGVAPRLFEGLAVRLLRNECVTVEGGNGRQLAVLGMDCTHHLPTDQRQLERLVGQAPSDVPLVLLYHAPDLMPEAAGYGISLYLCGHTHGGQVRLPWYGAIFTSSQLGKRYEMGHYHEGKTHLYVSRGIGLEGLSAPRLRFLSPPEMTLVTIRGKDEG